MSYNVAIERHIDMDPLTYFLLQLLLSILISLIASFLYDILKSLFTSPKKKELIP